MGWLYGAVLEKPSSSSAAVRAGKLAGPWGQSQTNRPMPAACSALKYLARHQAGHGAAGIEAAGPGLHVVGHAPIEFALHQQVQRL